MANAITIVPVVLGRSKQTKKQFLLRYDKSLRKRIVKEMIDQSYSARTVAERVLIRGWHKSNAGLEFGWSANDVHLELKRAISKVYHKPAFIDYLRKKEWDRAKRLKEFG